MHKQFQPHPLKQFEPPQKNGNLYYVRLNTPAGILYKIGFTTMRSVHERLAYNGAGNEKLIEKVIFFVYLEDAFDIECQLHELFKDKIAYTKNHSHETAPLYKSGQTELYRSDVLNLDTEFAGDAGFYRRQGLSEEDIQKSLRRQKLYSYALLPIIWPSVKILGIVLGLYEKFSKTNFFEEGRRRKKYLQHLLNKINSARG